MLLAANQNRKVITVFFAVFLRDGERSILRGLFLSFFYSEFSCSMHSKVIIIVIQFMFLGINIIWALLRAHFNPRLTPRAKMSLVGPKIYLCPRTKNLLF